jgi:hypothetical protein
MFVFGKLVVHVVDHATIINTPPSPAEFSLCPQGQQGKFEDTRSWYSEPSVLPVRQNRCMHCGSYVVLKKSSKRRMRVDYLYGTLTFRSRTLATFSMNLVFIVSCHRERERQSRSPSLLLP